ncbi:HAMP domain protein [Methylophaga lonarensis MPL]|uniref:HAMP domain protein n=1 Tax=Methylophaga lonarensis MPL TaxID=1286106 RepID=M7NY14_9GAMM|nr:HD domain-containing phosphohydrolase [Methylophaga lonarensis]EMR13693.1 HAMP domain protein [Methylophaga lonarensis MPL]
MPLMLPKRNFRISIRQAVISVFLLSTLLIATLVTGLQYYFNRAIATESTLLAYQHTAKGTRDYLENIDKKAISVTRLLSQYPRLTSGNNISTQARDLFAEVMLDNPIFYAIYVGFNNGNVYQLVNLEAHDGIRQQLRAEPADRWAIVSVSSQSGERQRRFEYFDAEFNRRDTRQHPVDYDASKRSWFTQAVPGSVHKTDPYLLQHLQTPGRTYSTRISEQNAVIAVDITLAALETFLQSQELSETSEIFLYQATGDVIASNQLPVEEDLPELPRLELTNSQQQLIDKGYLLVSNEVDWPPINFAVAGQPYGYAIDVLKAISSMTGVELRFVNGLSWPEMASMFLANELDIIQPVFFSEERQILGRMTDAFLEVPYGAITRRGSADISEFSQLNGHIVAIPRGWSLIGNLQRLFPEIDILEVDSVSDMFRAVSQGEAYAGVDSAIVLAHTRQQFFLEDIQLHQPLDPGAAALPTSLHFLVARDKSPLTDVFNQAISAIPASFWQKLQQKWLQPEMQARHYHGVVPYAELMHPDVLQQHDDLRMIDIAGETYFVYLTPIGGQHSHQEYFAILTPASLVMAPVLSRLKTSIALTILALLILLPFIWLFASPLIKQIRALLADSEKIKQRAYAQVSQVDSRITEIRDLASSMISMSESIQRHEAEQVALMESFIELIAQAIDDKSPYTAGHCARVPELAFMLAEKAIESDVSAFRDFRFENEQQWREFRIGAWLHDCGKITTPEHIIDKGTKLEAIYNRIHEVRMRFEVLWRDAEIQYWNKQSQSPEKKTEHLQALERQQQQLQADFEFIAGLNIGGESVTEEDLKRLEQLAEITWQRHFDDRLGLSPVEEARYVSTDIKLPTTEYLLADKAEHIIKRQYEVSFDPRLGINMKVPEHLYNLGEIHNLSIYRGTLTPEDRFKINEHMISTIKMLDSLPFPPELARVPRYASTHHETLTGSGYPRGLKAEDLSIPERIMVLADIFEALTAADRPYKRAKPVSVAIDILHSMVENQHVDRDVFELFLRSGIYLHYAQRFLPEEQIDEVDINQYFSQ